MILSIKTETIDKALSSIRYLRGFEMFKRNSSCISNQFEMRVCVIGGGIIGLSSALYLMKNDKSMDVTIVTDKITPETTADGAAGIWGIYLLKETPIEQQRRWAKETHDFIESLWTSENGGLMGISLVSSIRLNHDPSLISIWKDIVYGFRQMTSEEMKGFGRLSGSHLRGYQFMTYTIEPIKLLPFLLAEFMALGGKVIKKRVEDIGLLASQMNADLVINCTGVWASELTQDSDLAPLRGQVMRVKAPWIKEVILDDLDDGNYIIANQDSVVLGGTHQNGSWDTKADDDDRDFIWKGCKAMRPELINGAEFIKDWVGLRPGRKSVRLERDRINQKGRSFETIHNYGHGGSGITIFWGCAKEVYDMVSEIKAEQHGFMSKL